MINCLLIDISDKLVGSIEENISQAQARLLVIEAISREVREDILKLQGALEVFKQIRLEGAKVVKEIR